MQAWTSDYYDYKHFFLTLLQGLDYVFAAPPTDSGPGWPSVWVSRLLRRCLQWVYTLRWLCLRQRACGRSARPQHYSVSRAMRRQDGKPESGRRTAEHLCSRCITRPPHWTPLKPIRGHRDAVLTCRKTSVTSSALVTQFCSSVSAPPAMFFFFIIFFFNQLCTFSGWNKRC